MQQMYGTVDTGAHIVQQTYGTVVTGAQIVQQTYGTVVTGAQIVQQTYYGRLKNYYWPLAVFRTKLPNGQPLTKVVGPLGQPSEK